MDKPLGGPAQLVDERAHVKVGGERNPPPARWLKPSADKRKCVKTHSKPAFQPVLTGFALSAGRFNAPPRGG